MKVNNEFSAMYNRLREANQGKRFERKEIFELLADSVPAFPKSDLIITFFVKNGILIKEKDGRNTKYMFTSTPVHISSLSTCVFALKDYYKRNNKTRAEKVNATIETNRTPITEEYCINYLKQRGYRVMKKITKFEEVLTMFGIMIFLFFCYFSYAMMYNHYNNELICGSFIGFTIMKLS